jgi:colanic acid biosynthesis glycosyl transferase WcaI
MRILLINQYFPPDGGASAHLLGQLAEDLAATHTVQVIAGRPSYPAPPNELHAQGVSVSRVTSTSFGHGSLAGRASNYLTFLALAALRACRGPRPDVIVTLTNPPFLGLAGALAATRHRTKFVVVCHDVFPDLAVALGRLRNPVLKWAWDRVNRFVRARAARIVVVGRDMEQRLLSQGVAGTKLIFIPAWAERQQLDPDATRALRSEHAWAARFVVMHAGNLGLAQNVEILAELAERVRNTPEVLIVILGDGPARAGLERTVRDRGLRNVQMLEAVPRPGAQALMAAADLHVVSLAPGLWGCSAPSKTYGIMAAGRPFVAAVDAGAEPDLIANEVGCGWRVGAGDADALAAAVLALRDEPLDEMGERGRRAFEQTYAREHLTALTARVLEDVVADGALAAGSGP